MEGEKKNTTNTVLSLYGKKEKRLFKVVHKYLKIFTYTVIAIYVNVIISEQRQYYFVVLSGCFVGGGGLGGDV